jgi:uncharacterized coiled-coil DUF342 family protein
MSYETTITAIGTVAGVGGLVYAILKSFKDEISQKFDDVNRKFDDVNRKFDDVNRKFDDVNRHIDRLDEKLELQGKRTDHLYEICIGLLKDRKKN